MNSKRIISFIVIILVLVSVGTFGFASSAGAQEVRKGGSNDVECQLLNFTDPSVKNPDHSYPVGTPIKLETMLNDPGNQVVHIVFNFLFGGGKGNDIQSGSERSVIWTPPEAGTWRVVAQLFDSDQNEIIPRGDCDVELVVKEASAETPAPAKPAPTTVITPAPAVTAISSAPAPAGELAVTGINSKTTRTLSLLGIMLITLGGLLLVSSRRKLRVV